MREVDLGFPGVVFALVTAGVTLDREAGSEAVVELLGGGRTREIGRGFAFAFDFGGRLDSSTAMLVSSSPFLASPLTFSLSLAFATRPAEFSASASFSEPDASLSDLRGRFRAERGIKTDACERAGEGLDLRAEDVPTLRDGEGCESRRGSWLRIP